MFALSGKGRLRAFALFLLLFAPLLMSPAVADAQSTTAVTLSSSNDCSLSSQLVTLTAVVAAVSPATGTPTGTVTFSDGANTLGTVALSDGQAVFSTMGFSLGLHVITAVYGGDGNFGSATSGILIQSVATAGSPWAWGLDSNGQLGNDTTADSSVPVPVGSLASIVSIAGGGYHSLAVKNDGTLWSCGYNGAGELGNNSTADSSVPVQVSSLAGVVAASAGDYDSLALLSDGTVWAWGDNSEAELGSNSFADSSLPIQVEDSTGTSYLTGVTAIASGGYHNLALESDGTVWAWGLNEYGQLGNNNTTISGAPVQVEDSTGTTYLTGITAVAAGYYHSLAVRSDGTVWAWGYNPDGELGNNTTTDSSLPVQVVGPTGTSYLTGVVAVAAGYDYSLALKGDGTVWAWGGNEDGQLGNNSTTSSSVPVQVEDPTGSSYLTAVAAIAAGYYHCLALESDGTVWSWGYNEDGELGDYAAGYDSGLPVPVSDSTGTTYLTGAVAIAAGGYQSIAISAVVPSVTVTSSQNPSNPGQSTTFTATVSAVAPAAGTPTGTVTFLDGSTALGTQTLSNGAAVFSISTLSGGNHTITVLYSGDSSFAPAVSAALTQAVIAWTPLSAVPAPDGTTHLLWADNTGRAHLRILAAGGSVSSSTTFGPFAGWQALALSVAPDSSNHIVWQYTDGTVSVWKIDEAGDMSSLAYTLYGPYAGWNPVGISTATDSSDHLLWKYTNNAISDWRISSTGSLSYYIYGPYAGWSPVGIAAANDLSDHVLWKSINNTMSAWRINTSSGAFTYQLDGPYAGWTPVSIGVDASDANHILWNDVDGTMSIWDLGSAGALSYYLYGPYASWSAAAVNIGPVDGDAYVLWTYPGGTLSVWNISSPGVFTYNIQSPPAS